MNPRFNNMSNAELSRELDCWASDADVKKRRAVPLSPDMVRLIAERLLMATDEDIEAAVNARHEEVLANVRQKLKIYVSRMQAVAEDAESTADAFEVELFHDGLGEESTDEDDE